MTGRWPWSRCPTPRSTCSRPTPGASCSTASARSRDPTPAPWSGGPTGTSSPGASTSPASRPWSTRGPRARAEFAQPLIDGVRRLEALEIPTLALVHGLCLTAGLEISLGCDLIWAAESAKFGLVEAVVGLTPGAGGTQRMAERAGPGRAREFVMTGGLFDAATLERWSVVNRVRRRRRGLREGDALRRTAWRRARPAPTPRPSESSAATCRAGSTGRPRHAGAVRRPVRDRGPPGRRADVLREGSRQRHLRGPLRGGHTERESLPCPAHA